VVLRQHYLVGGESLVNEWHALFLAERRRSASESARGAHPPRGSAVQFLSPLRDPLNAGAPERPQSAGRVHRALGPPRAKLPCACPSTPSPQTSRRAPAGQHTLQTWAEGVLASTTVTLRANAVQACAQAAAECAQAAAEPCVPSLRACSPGQRVDARARAQAPQMDVIDEELDEPLAQAAGRVPSSMSQLSQLPAYVRRNSFDVQGRRCAAQTRLAAPAAHPH